MWGKQDIDVALIAFEPWILLEEFMAYRFVLFPKWNAPCGTLSILDASMALSIYYADNAGGGGGRVVEVVDGGFGLGDLVR
jgi:hypothetical protein